MSAHRLILADPPSGGQENPETIEVEADDSPPPRADRTSILGQKLAGQAAVRFTVRLTFKLLRPGNVE